MSFIEIPYTRTKIGNKDWYFPKVQISLTRMGRVFNTDAIVDSGADYSLFKFEIAEALGLPFERTATKTVKGISGDLKTHIFDLELEFAGTSFKAPLEFSRDYKFRYNILGRIPFFEKFKVTFDERNKKMLFERNDEI